MTTPLAEAFCLKKDRRNFQINVRASEVDRKAYFGKKKMNKKLIDDIHQCYLMGVPAKMYIRGLYGVGKTHMLFYLQYHVAESPEATYKVKCPYVECEFGKKTGFNYLYGQMMNAIGMEEVSRLIQEYLQRHAGPDLRSRLVDVFRDADVATAIHTLGVAAHDVTLWKWLCGGTLTPAELTTLRLTKNLTSAGNLTATLVAIGKLFQEEKHINYLFLLDELEGLRNVQDVDCQRSFHDAFRRLADEANDSIGFIVSIYAAKDGDIPEFIFEADIRTRLGGHNIHELTYFQEPEDVEDFLQDLIDLVIDEKKVEKRVKAGAIPDSLKLYPFSENALETFIETATSSATASLPRNIIKAVNECAVEALNRHSPVIDTEDLGPCQSIFVEVEY